jgi:GntR family transcriptional regulator, transcriptional repressor for pyruvate dehydrogenase complex
MRRATHRPARPPAAPGAHPSHSLRRLERTSVRAQVFAQLKNQILTGEWEPGSRIPSENQLSKMLGVSRISVREALQKMVALDLLESRQGDGTFVRRLQADQRMNRLIPMMLLARHDILDVLEYRRLVETGIVALAVERATPEDVVELEALLKKMRRVEGNHKEFAECDLEFHLALARMTRNPVIIKITGVIKDVLSASMVDIVSKLGVGLGLHYHAQILAAVKGGDRMRAQKVMSEHIKTTIEEMGRRGS